MPSTAKQKALCVATRCTSAEQFIETFHRFCDEHSFFVATTNMRPVGLETPFSIQLANKAPVLQGLCIVLAAYASAQNPYKRPGIRLGIRRLTPESEAVFYQLQAMRTAAPQDVVTEASEAHTLPPIPMSSLPAVPPPTPKVKPAAGAVVATPIVRTAPLVSATPRLPASPPKPALPVPEPEPEPAPVVARVPTDRTLETTLDEQRTPGSELILPANPLQHLSDESLEGFVDCTLYEETANFFRAPDDDKHVDDVIEPPKPAVVDAVPQFNPSQVIASAFPEEAPPEPSLAQPLPLPPPVAESLDTSRPIDELARATPMPAGEAYAPARKVKPKTWLVAGGAAVAACVASVLVLVTRPGEDTPVKAAVPPPAPAKTIEPPPPEPPPPPDEPEPPEPPAVDGDELAAVTDPATPAVGDGPCKLDITTTPAGTMVKLDGQTIGPSPISVGGPCTRRKVELVHPRYKAEQRFVTLVADKPSTIDVTLVRPTHTLTVVSKPPGATVYIAGRRAGTTPTKLSLMGFSGLDVKLEKAGFETVKKRIYSKVPQDSLSVTLKRSLWLKK